MKHYVGLDVSLKVTHFCLVDQDGQIVEQSDCPTSPEDLFSNLLTYKATIETVVLETGGQSSWLQRRLSDLGLPAVIVDALSCRLCKKISDRMKISDSYRIPIHFRK